MYWNHQNLKWHMLEAVSQDINTWPFMIEIPVFYD